MRKEGKGKAHVHHATANEAPRSKSTKVLGLILMGGAYFLIEMIPAVFIREKVYDPQQARVSAAVAETI